MQRIGLIGGLGVVAGMHYYKHLADAFVARGAQPGLLVSHADLGRAYTLVQEDKREELARYLNEHLMVLADAGCDFAALAAVTPLICAPELDRIAALPRIDVFDAVNAELRRRKAKRVAIMGTQFVMRTHMFGRLQNVEILPMSADEFELVQNNYLVIARTGDPGDANLEAVRAVGRRLADAGADAIILAGTELSLAFNEQTAGFPALDAGRVHIDAILERALSA